jgi:hypothetical protein
VCDSDCRRSPGKSSPVDDAHPLKKGKIYRTLIVWGRRWVILILPVILYFLDIGKLQAYSLPCMILTTSTATSIWFTWSITEAPTGKNVLDTTAFQRSMYFFATTLAVNLVCTCTSSFSRQEPVINSGTTGLIAFKIWMVQRGVVGYVNGFRRARNALSIVLESGAWSSDVPLIQPS